MQDLEEALEMLAIRFQDRCARDLVELSKLSLADPLDDPGIRMIAHGLAGAGGTFGFPQVSARARELEQAIDSGASTLAALGALLGEMDRCAEAAPVFADFSVAMSGG